jgi:phage recombination protein Bet
MSKIMALQSYNDAQVANNGNQHFSSKQIEILKNSICRGVSNEEFEIFLMACTKTQLDPFMKQIYAVKRKSKKPDGSWGETMTIQTGIDGYRLIAERTSCYAPGPEPTYTYDGEGKVMSSTAYIKKQTRDGTWHIVSASAFLDEYCQKTRDGNPIGMWGNMPRTMLAKCAEAQALRKAFPAEMSGIYTKEEMEQADVITIPKITFDQVEELEQILTECDPKYKDWVYSYIKKMYKANSIGEVPIEWYEKMRSAAIKNKEENLMKQKEINLVPQEVS